MWECGNVEATKGGEQASWASEGRCKRPSGVRGGARSKKYVSKMKTNHANVFRCIQTVDGRVSDSSGVNA